MLFLMAEYAVYSTMTECIADMHKNNNFSNLIYQSLFFVLNAWRNTLRIPPSIVLHFLQYTKIILYLFELNVAEYAAYAAIAVEYVVYVFIALYEFVHILDFGPDLPP